MDPSEESDDLWKLLGRARRPSVSPFFAPNILRDIRSDRQENLGVFARLRWHWQVGVAGLAGAALITLAATHFIGNDDHNRQMDSLMAITEQISASPDFYVINDLDDLLASEETSVWLDSSVH